MPKQGGDQVLVVGLESAAVGLPNAVHQQSAIGRPVEKGAEEGEPCLVRPHPRVPVAVEARGRLRQALPGIADGAAPHRWPGVGGHPLLPDSSGDGGDAGPPALRNFALDARAEPGSRETPSVEQPAQRLPGGGVGEPTGAGQD
jgi:hypothetical protein